MAIPEPVDDPWWGWVKALVALVWPPDDEDVAEELGNAWDRAADALQTAIEAADRGADAVDVVWLDVAGIRYAREIRKLSNGGRVSTEGLGAVVTRMREMAGQAHQYAETVEHVKLSIKVELAINAALFAATLLLPPGIGDLFRWRIATQIAANLSRFVETMAGTLMHTGVQAGLRPLMTHLARDVVSEGLEEGATELIAEYLGKNYGYRDHYDPEAILVNMGAGGGGSLLGTAVHRVAERVVRPARHLVGSLAMPAAARGFRDAMADHVGHGLQAMLVNGFTSPVAGYLAQSAADGTVLTWGGLGASLRDGFISSAVLGAARVHSTLAGSQLGNAWIGRVHPGPLATGPVPGPPTQPPVIDGSGVPRAPGTPSGHGGTTAPTDTTADTGPGPGPGSGPGPGAAQGPGTGASASSNTGTGAGLGSGSGSGSTGESSAPAGDSRPGGTPGAGTGSHPAPSQGSPSEGSERSAGRPVTDHPAGRTDAPGTDRHVDRAAGRGTVEPTGRSTADPGREVTLHLVAADHPTGSSRTDSLAADDGGTTTPAGQGGPADRSIGPSGMAATTAGTPQATTTGPVAQTPPAATPAQSGSQQAPAPQPQGHQAPAQAQQASASQVQAQQASASQAQTQQTAAPQTYAQRGPSAQSLENGPAPADSRTGRPGWSAADQSKDRAISRQGSAVEADSGKRQTAVDARSEEPASQDLDPLEPSLEETGPAPADSGVVAPGGALAAAQSGVRQRAGQFEGGSPRDPVPAHTLSSSAASSSDDHAERIEHQVANQDFTQAGAEPDSERGSGRLLDRFVPGWFLVAVESARAMVGADLVAAAGVASIEHEGGGTYRITTPDDLSFRVVKRVGHLPFGTVARYVVPPGAERVAALTLSDLLTHDEIAPILARVVAEAAATFTAGDGVDPVSADLGAKVFSPGSDPRLDPRLKPADRGDLAELRQRSFGHEQAGPGRPLRRAGMRDTMAALIESMSVAAGQPNTDVLRALISADDRALVERFQDRASPKDDRVGNAAYVAKALRSSGWTAVVLGSAAFAFTGSPLVGVGLAVPTLVNSLVGALAERWLDGKKEAGRQPAYDADRDQRNHEHPGMAGLLDGRVERAMDRQPAKKLPRATKQRYYVQRHAVPTVAAAAVAGALTVAGVPALSTVAVIGTSALAKMVVDRLIDSKKFDFRLARVDSSVRQRLQDPQSFENQLTELLLDFRYRVDRAMAALSGLGAAAPERVFSASDQRSLPTDGAESPGTPPLRVHATAQGIDNISSAARRVVFGGQSGPDLDPTELARQVSSQVEGFINAIGPGLLGVAVGSVVDSYVMRREEAAGDAQKNWTYADSEATQGEALLAALHQQLADLQRVVEGVESLVPQGGSPVLTDRVDDRGGFPPSRPDPPARPAGPRPHGQAPRSVYAFQIASAAIGGVVGTVGLDLLFDLPDLSVVLTLAGAVGAVTGTPAARYLFRRAELGRKDRLADALGKQAVDRARLIEQRAIARYVMAQVRFRVEQLVALQDPASVEPGVVSWTDPEVTDRVRAAVGRAHLDNLPPPRPESASDRGLRAERISALTRIDRLAAAVDHQEAVGSPAGVIAARDRLRFAISLYGGITDENGRVREFPDLATVDPAEGRRVTGGHTDRIRAGVAQAQWRLVAEPEGKPVLRERLVALEKIAEAADAVDRHARYGEGIGTADSHVLMRQELDAEIEAYEQLLGQTEVLGGFILPAVGPSPTDRPGSGEPAGPDPGFAAGRQEPAGLPKDTGVRRSGRNEAQWITDGNGHVRTLRARLRETFPDQARTSAEKRDQAAAAARGVEGDDGGHLLGRRFFRAGDLANLVPQNSNLNRGAYRKLENEWAAWIRQGYEVEVRIGPMPGQARPSEIWAIYSVLDTGVTPARTVWAGGRAFVNASGQVFSRYTRSSILRFSPGAEDLFVPDGGDSAVPDAATPAVPRQFPPADGQEVDHLPADEQQSVPGTQDRESDQGTVDEMGTVAAEPPAGTGLVPRSSIREVLNPGSRPPSGGVAEPGTSMTHLDPPGPSQDAGTPGGPGGPPGVGPLAGKDADGDNRTAHGVAPAVLEASAIGRPAPNWDAVSRLLGRRIIDPDVAKAARLARIEFVARDTYRAVPARGDGEPFLIYLRAGTLDGSHRGGFATLRDGSRAAFITVNARIGARPVARTLANLIRQLAEVARVAENADRPPMKPSVLRMRGDVRFDAELSPEDHGGLAEVVLLDRQARRTPAYRVLRQRTIKAQMRAMLEHLTLADGQQDAVWRRRLLTAQDRRVVERWTRGWRSIGDPRLRGRGYLAKAMAFGGLSTMAAGVGVGLATSLTDPFTTAVLAGVGLAAPMLASQVLGAFTDRWLDGRRELIRYHAIGEEYGRIVGQAPGLQELTDPPAARDDLPADPRIDMRLGWSWHIVRRLLPAAAGAGVAVALSPVAPVLAPLLMFGATAVVGPVVDRFLEQRRNDAFLARLRYDVREELAAPDRYQLQLTQHVRRLRERLQAATAINTAAADQTHQTDQGRPESVGAGTFVRAELSEAVPGFIRRLVPGAPDPRAVDPTALARLLTDYAEGLLFGLANGGLGAIAAARLDAFVQRRNDAAADTLDRFDRIRVEARENVQLMAQVSDALAGADRAVRLAERFAADVAAGVPTSSRDWERALDRLTTASPPREQPGRTMPSVPPPPSEADRPTGNPGPIVAIAHAGPPVVVAATVLGVHLGLGLPAGTVFANLLAAGAQLIAVPAAKWVAKLAEVRRGMHVITVRGDDTVNQRGLVDKVALVRFAAGQIEHEARLRIEGMRPVGQQPTRTGIHGMLRVLDAVTPLHPRSPDYTDRVRGAVAEAHRANVRPAGRIPGWGAGLRQDRHQALLGIERLASQVDDLAETVRRLEVAGGRVPAAARVELAQIRYDLVRAIGDYHGMTDSSGAAPTFPDLATVRPVARTVAPGNYTDQVRAAVDEAWDRLRTEPEPLLQTKRVIALNRVRVGADAMDFLVADGGADPGRLALARGELKRAIWACAYLQHRAGVPGGFGVDPEGADTP